MTELVLREEYTKKISSKLSVGKAIGITLWVLSIFLFLAGMVVILLAGIIAFFCAGTVSQSAVNTIENSQGIVSGFADATDELIENGEYSQAVTETGESLESMADALDEISKMLEDAGSIPFIGTDMGISESAQDMKNAAVKMRNASDSIESASGNLDNAENSVAEASEKMRTEAMLLGKFKTEIESATGLIQIAIVAITIGLECMFGGCICLALAYGPPANAQRKKDNKKMETTYQP